MREHCIGGTKNKKKHFDAKMLRKSIKDKLATPMRLYKMRYGIEIGNHS